MALRSNLLCRTYMTQNSGDRKERNKNPAAAEQFMALASVFRRRFLTGIGSASLIAVGANFVGITSFLLGISPDNARKLKLDVIYPIGGYSRCVDSTQGFEFIYPVDWVGDETLLYRAAGKAEFERSLDPPSLSRRRNIRNEPVVAFGPPASTGELNVSVIVSQVPPDFSIEAFGEADEVGQAVVKTVASGSGSGGRQQDVKGSLVRSKLREDLAKNMKYYEIEFKVESPSFNRHNVAVCCVRAGKLFTFNAQAPESMWPMLESKFYTIAHSFLLT